MGYLPTNNSNWLSRTEAILEQENLGFMLRLHTNNPQKSQKQLLDILYLSGSDFLWYHYNYANEEHSMRLSMQLNQGLF